MGDKNMEQIKATLFENRLCATLIQSIDKSKLRYHDFSKTLMVKPWGIEFMNYEAKDKSCCSWCLHINPHGETSMHCHATKQTIIHIISGSIVLKLLNNMKIMEAGDSFILDKQVFHAMRARSTGAVLLEIESPSYKPDAIRFADPKDRVDKPYESKCKWVVWE